ncbi:MAG: PEP-CTERM sorting domain-containing protein [Alphaproteobacteria bacterium]|nr:PEP-CTERM sorting domain-containing protein [Alphaproteobacteria bacterium]
MRKFAMAIFAIMSIALSATTAQAILYNVDQTIGIGGVTGTISTDGTIGILGNGNISDWNLVLDDGVSTFNLLGDGSGGDNSNVLVIGGNFSATATDLLFNFDGAGFALFQNPDTGSGINFWCLEGTFACDVTPNTQSVGLQAATLVAAQAGIVTIGSVGRNIAVSEPGTLALLSVGLLGMGIARVRRRKFT